MSKEYEKLTEEQKALNGLANFIIMHGNNDDYDASAIEWHDILKQAIIELEELKHDLKRYFITRKYNDIDDYKEWDKRYEENKAIFLKLLAKFGVEEKHE